jgi:hypothetical protein
MPHEPVVDIGTADAGNLPEASAGWRTKTCPAQAAKLSGHAYLTLNMRHHRIKV